MKKLFLLILFLNFFVHSFAQQHNILSRKQPVTIINWDKRAIFFMPNFWPFVKPQLEKIMGPALVDSIIKYAETGKWPEGFYEPVFDDKNNIAPNRNTLKMYKVADFINSSHIKEVVLWVPQADNKNWKNGVIWKNDLFFIIPEEAIKIRL